LLRSKPKKVEIVLNGGLGNQLFQYFAGQYIANRFGGELRADSTFSQFGRSGHSDWISAINLPGQISPLAPAKSRRYYFSIGKRRYRELLNRVALRVGLKLKIFRQYQSSVLGYDPNLDQIKPPMTITGYFQTWKYYQALKDRNLVPELRVNTPSDWFLGMVAKHKTHTQVLGIHVRRGDYVGNSNFGTLSVAYYEAAVEELRSRGVTWEVIWVFSDDVTLTESEFSGSYFANMNILFVYSPPESHSFESLLLMSKCSSLVIANSTFSWWAATLGNPDKITACPSKWFAQMEDPQDLYPESWIPVQSSWITH
jgi:hypothetical protein